MKLVRYLNGLGVPTHGIWQDDGIRAITGNIFGEWQPASELIPHGQVDRILAPVDPPNIFAIGLNYKAHADEGGQAYPKAPVIFIKATTALTTHHSPILIPPQAPGEVDYEGEMALIIGRRARNVSEDEALDCVLGYTAANDVSARDCQLVHDVQWARGKSFDTFCPLGPIIQTAGDPDNRHITTRLNGQVVQDSNTNDLIFSCRKLVSYLSRQFTLLPGTVILTGTPSGVGWARKPRLYLKPGDEVEVEVEGVGTLSNTVALGD